MPVVRRAAKPFWSSLLERYWPETEDPSNELGSTVSFKAPVFSYVTDLARLFALAKGWVITFGVYQHFDASGEAGLSPDQPGALEGEHHLVSGRRAHAEVTLHVGLGRRTAVDTRVGVEEGQIRTLLVGQTGPKGRHSSRIYSSAPLSR